MPDGAGPQSTGEFTFGGGRGGEGKWLCGTACRILAPKPGIGTLAKAVEVRDSQPLDFRESLVGFTCSKDPAILKQTGKPPRRS